MFTYKIDDELELRLITQADAQEIYAFIEENRSYLREWLGWLDYSTELLDVQKHIHRNLMGFVTDSMLDTAIIYEGKIVGKVGFNEIDKSLKKASIGYMLDQNMNGKGIMTRAVKAITAIGFEHYQLNKIEIHAAVGNMKSRAIPEKLGFTEEGTIRNAEWLYDKYVDDVVYGMLREEWQQD